MMLAAGCRYTITSTAGLPLARPGVAQVLDRILHVGHVGQPHRRTVAIGDDQPAVVVGLHQLIVGGHFPGALAVGEMALGRVGVGARQHAAHVAQADSVLVERGRVQVHAHGRQRAAADLHLADALDLRQLLLQDGRGGVVHLPLGRGLRGEREDQHRCVRRVDLAVGRIARQVGGELAAGRVDRSLHVARGAIDVTVEVELQDDVGRADAAGRGHLGDAGDAAELTLERGRHRGGHGLRTCARQARRHADRGEIHLRQRRDRQELEGNRSRHRQSGGQQRRGDRAMDEGRGDVQGCSSPSAAGPEASARGAAARRASRSNAR